MQVSFAFCFVRKELEILTEERKKKLSAGEGGGEE